MRSDAQAIQFEMLILPHLDSGLNLALWLVSNRSDAEDSLQEASIKAFKSLRSFRGADAKAWFLAIVRNECMNSLRRRNVARFRELSFDEGLDVVTVMDTAELVIRGEDQERVVAAIDSLPALYREVLLLREIEELSYQEIASVTGVPMGTVMSRLARARTAVAKSVGGVG